MQASDDFALRPPYYYYTERVKSLAAAQGKVPKGEHPVCVYFASGGSAIEW
jgi:hypothetical protein